MPGALRFGKPGERPHPKIFDLEQLADLPSGAIGDDERARLGKSLQPGRKVGCLPDDATLLRRTGSNQIADHDEAAGDPEPCVQRLGRSEANDRVDDGEPGTDRSFRVILVRLGIAEIDQHTVAHVLGNKTVEADDRIGDAAVVLPDQLAQILRVKTGREGR